MNDQTLMDNYLLILKSTVEVYVHGTLESTNKDVRSLLKKCLDNTMSMQENTYKEMVNNNWYVIKNTDSKKIKTVLQKTYNNNY